MAEADAAAPHRRRSVLVRRKACPTLQRQKATLSSVSNAVLGGALETKYLDSSVSVFFATISQ